MRAMTETRRFCWALAAAAFSLVVLAMVAISADQRPARGALTDRPTQMQALG
jgi:hypothetical protein